MLAVLGCEVTEARGFPSTQQNRKILTPEEKKRARTLQQSLEKLVCLYHVYVKLELIIKTEGASVFS